MMSARHRLPSGHHRGPRVAPAHASAAAVDAARRALYEPLRNAPGDQLIAERAQLHAEAAREAQLSLPLASATE